MADTKNTYTPAEMLAEVDKAIQAILVGGQSDRKSTRLNSSHSV